MTDWDSWHGDYEDPTSLLSERLRVVQKHIVEWLDATQSTAVTVVSSCAGDGRDLLQVLEGRADANRVTATLLEADSRNASRAREAIQGIGLSNIEVRCTDAGITTAYVGVVPADLVLLCGIFGNISDGDVHGTIAAAPQFCQAQACVIWTRHRQDPDLAPQIRGWFSEYGFAEEAFVAPQHGIYSVGVQTYLGDPRPLEDERRLFTFNR